MKIFPFIFTTVLLVACTKTPPQLPEGIVLIAKYIVLDEDLSPNHCWRCPEEVKPFEEMGDYGCSFTLGKYEFDMDDKFVLDEHGGISEFWNYLGEGPAIHTKKTFESDQKYFEYIGGPDFYVNIADGGSAIYDSGDTVVIDQIFPKQKLILMERKVGYEREGRRVIFEYR